MSAFNTCYKWTEENNVQVEDIPTLKRLALLQAIVMWGERDKMSWQLHKITYVMYYDKINKTN
jgi:hypothetical protein